MRNSAPHECARQAEPAVAPQAERLVVLAPVVLLDSRRVLGGGALASALVMWSGIKWRTSALFTAVWEEAGGDALDDAVEAGFEAGVAGQVQA